MKTWAVLLVLLLVLVSPCIAEASLELGTTSTLALNLEQPRWSVGLGLNVRWDVYRNLFYSEFDTSNGYPYFDVWSGDATLIVLEPSVTARLFLSTDRTVQPFLVTRVRHEFSIVSSESDRAEEDVAEWNDSWRFDIGGGIRSELSSRFAIGGEVVARTSLDPREGEPSGVGGATDFLLFLQYRP